MCVFPFNFGWYHADSEMDDDYDDNDGNGIQSHVKELSKGQKKSWDIKAVWQQKRMKRNTRDYKHPRGASRLQISMSLLFKHS